jgi:hypothetical protein
VSSGNSLEAPTEPAHGKCARPVVGSEMPTFTLDLEGIITCCNAAFLWLLDCEADDDVLGASFLSGDFWARPQDESLLRQTLRRGRSDLLRVTVRTGPQAAKPILLLLAALKNDVGKTAGWQGVAWRQD